MHHVAHPLAHARLTAHDSLAVVCGDARLTYRDVDERCRRLAGHLRSLRLAKGDRVAIIARNCHRYIETYIAVPAAGYVLVPLNARNSDVELADAITDSGARVLVTDRPPSDLDDLFDAVVRIPDGYEEVLERASEIELGGGVHEDDLAGLFYTGGTTGRAKGVMLTHRNLVANTLTALRWARLTRHDRWLVMAPMFHAAGTCCVLATIWAGGRHVVLPAFDPAAVLGAVEEHRVTCTLAVPTMLAAMAEEQLSRPRDVTSLRLLSHGASPVATETLRRAVKAFREAELIHLYGTTETSPIATAMPHEEELLDTPQARSCGQPAIGVEVRVVDRRGTPAPARAVGEVLIRGANVMRGYWGKPEETAAAFEGGWYRTGDVGWLDEHGFLFLVDRLKDMIVSGGENVYPAEVENALSSHPAVTEVAVFGVPDERWGEAVQATVVARTPVSTDELQAYCRERIAGFKVPKRIDISTEPLPKSAAGKILKRELREPFWAGRDTRIGD